MTASTLGERQIFPRQTNNAMQRWSKSSDLKTNNRITIFFCQPVFLIPMATFMRGMKELLIKEILFEHIDENRYYININYIFNGDRLAFLKTYELDTGEVVDAIENPNQGLLPFDGEISAEYFVEDTALFVPYSEAEEFKAIASDFCPERRWDNERKMWVVKAGTPKEPFCKWF